MDEQEKDKMIQGSVFLGCILGFLVFCLMMGFGVNIWFAISGLITTMFGVAFVLVWKMEP